MLDSLPLDNISSFGADIDGIMSYIWWVTAGWLVAAELVLVYFLVKYRKKDGVRAAWAPATGSKALMWVIVPVLAVTAFDMVIEHRSSVTWDKIKLTSEIPEHDVLVRITARQFAWDFTYAGADGKLGTADDFTSMTEFHVPKGKVVRFQLESQDVIHSFWVPALRFKQDVVPGRFIPGWFDTSKVGQYEIACAEICGASHTQMRAILVVESAENFETWAQIKAEQHALRVN